jgi:hypothetical protein
MSQMLALSEEAYTTLMALANERGQSPEAVVEDLIAAAQADATRDPHTDPRYQTFEEFFRGLGMTSEEIRQARQSAKAADADV